MKRFFYTIVILFITFTLNAQDKTENQGQSIELPDFVITGVQSIEIPVQKKPRPELIPILSKDFFNPIYAPEEFELSDFSKPVKKDAVIFNNNNANNGMFYVGAGIHTLPTGEFYFNTGSEHFLLSANLWGTNIKDYENYSDYNISGANLNTDFFVGINSSFMPGLKISLNADYVRDAYRFYGTFNPADKREREKGKAGISFSNLLNKNIKYSLDFSGSVFKLSDNALQENVTSANGFIELNMNKLAAGGNVLFKTQALKNYFPDTKNNFISTSAYLKIKTSSALHAKIGITYSKQDSNSFIAPNASVSAKLGKNLAFFGEYSPYAEFNTIDQLTEKNRFYILGFDQNIFTEVKSNFKGTLKYQYNRYFEISAGVGYSKIDNFIYFAEIVDPGEFYLMTADDVNKTYMFADLLFYLGPYGEFYGSTLYQSVKTSGGNYIPYIPKLSAELLYKFNFTEDLYVKMGIQFEFDYQSDLMHRKIRNDFNNLFASFGYSITNNLLFKATVENILNSENYRFNNYKEKPFDVLAGVEYRW